MLEGLKEKEKVVGIKQSLKQLKKGTVKKVFIADDADRQLMCDIEELCKKKDVNIVHVNTMKELGKICGIDVGASVMCVLEE